MIGDTFAIFQHSSTPWGDLPGQSSNTVYLVKVNQDNYSAEYRKSVTGGRYVLKIRNTVEPARADRGAINRHNFELTYTKFADAANGTPEETYQTYWVARFPPNGDSELAQAIFYAATQSPTEAQLTKIQNFES